MKIHKPPLIKASTWLLGFLLFGFLIGCLMMLVFPSGHAHHSDSSVLSAFLNLRLNEMGDTFAGLFGSLAFLAAAVAVFLQSRELSSQRKELELTRKVMEHQQLAAEDMAASMKSQLSLIMDERTQRDLDKSEKVFEAKLIHLCQMFEDSIETSRFCKWLLTSHMPVGGTPMQSINISKNPDQFLRMVHTTILSRERGFEALDEGIVEFDRVLFEGETNVAALPRCIVLIAETLSLKDNLAADQKIRIEGLKLETIAEFLAKICANPEGYGYPEIEPPQEWGYQ